MNDSVLVLRNQLQYLKFNICSKKFLISSPDEYERTLLNIAAREGKHFFALWDDSC